LYSFVQFSKIYAVALFNSDIYHYIIGKLFCQEEILNYFELIFSSFDNNINYYIIYKI